MGSSIRPLLFAASLLSMAATMLAPAHAQQAEQPSEGFSLPPSNRPAPDPNRQGPELNVYRDPVTPRATPPAVAPPVVAPRLTPPVQVQPVPTSPTEPARPRPAQPESREQRRAEPAAPASEPERATPTVPVPADDAATTDQRAADAPPPQISAPATNDTAPAAPEPPAPLTPPAQTSAMLPWIISGALALLALGAALLLLRRRRSAEPVDQAPVGAVPDPVPTPAREPVRPAPSEPEPDAAPVAAPVAAAADRPWIDMDMVVSQARYSLMGVTIAYSLILHNRGDREAQDILVRGIMGNAGAQQQALLQGFFTGQDGLPLHSAVSIAPGESRQLAGELRLPTDRIVPVDMGQRSLLIPIAAFDAAYRWGAGEGEPLGAGRTARAFIVGQEQEPPTDRLAPLRLDQGPRQYRRPAARAAVELTPA